jgi:WD40 repeat protein
MVLLQGHENNIPGIDISGCGKFLCSCSIDGTFLVWMIGLPMHPPMWFKSRDVTK